MPWHPLRRFFGDGSSGRDLALLWTSTTTSAAGDAVTLVALPLVALVTLHASTFDVGLVSAATVGAWIVLGLPAGVWVDRLPKRPMLVTCDVVRAAALVSVPIAAAAHVLTLAHLVVVALVVSVGSVFAGIGFQSWVPSVVSAERLLPANSRLQGGEQAAAVGGPALGGALVQLVGAPVSLVADVASYVVSVSCLRGVGRAGVDPPRQESRGRLVEQVSVGLRFLWRDPVLRPLAFAAASINLWSTAITTLTTPFLLRTVHVSPAMVGVMFAADGLGGVLGATVVGRLVGRLGNARTLVVAVSVGPALTLLIPLTSGGAGLLLFAVGAAGFAVFVVAFSVVARVYRQTVTPPHMLGRLTSVNKFISWGVMPVGALLAGALGSAIGNREAMWVVTAGVLVTTPLSLAFSPIRRSRDLAALAGPAAPMPPQPRSGSPADGSGGSVPLPAPSRAGSSRPST